VGIVRIGIDDTDSKRGMCTTYLGAVVVDRLRLQGHSLEGYPKLVRLNPNWHLKTRGNCAVSLDVMYIQSELEDLKELVLNTVQELAELDCETTNPGVVFYSGKSIPEVLRDFSGSVVKGIVEIEDAERVAHQIGAEYHKFKLGRGIIGALAAIGEKFEQDRTYELLAYRTEDYRGRERVIDNESVSEMDKKTFPRTFDNIDKRSGEIRITPHTPCPVLFGIRSQDPIAALEAFHMVRASEPIERWIIYQTNQATDAHLLESTISDLRPVTSAAVRGKVSKNPKVIQGGHVIFSLRDGSDEIDCAAYEPTREFRNVINKLEVGDTVRVYGGVKKKTNLPLTLNLEKIEIQDLSRIYLKVNPTCARCVKRAKSEGSGKGYQCEVCGQRFPAGSETYVEKPRELQLGFYEVPPRARRHLAKPLIRIVKGKSAHAQQ
jgi:tRNA(Ile2)-agmatinylcytidine synthase